jgi:two-component system NtrC family sensor kinase
MDVEKTLSDTLNLMDVVCKREGIKLERTFDASEKTIVGSPGKLQQVIMNLVTNAKDALSEHENPKISLHVINEGNELVISVEDNGHGIEEEYLDQIFNRYFTTKEIGKGTGLGLAISNDIVQKMNGSILVNSTKGKGTKFVLRFPIASEES